MNEKVGTTKLLWLPRDKGTPDALRTDVVALRAGVRSSSVALIDGTDASKLLIFQITYTEANHAAQCLDFLASGDASGREKVKLVFVDRRLPEFEARLPELMDRTRLINYAEQLPKAAGLLFNLTDCHEDLLYPPMSGSVCQAATNDNCLLIDSTEAGSHVTRVTGGQRGTQALPEAAHKALAGARKALASSDDLLPLMSTEAAPQEGDESVDCQLAHLLHNLPPLTQLSDELRSALTKSIQPALKAYADVIKEVEGAGFTIYICDSIFNGELCRRAFMDAGVGVAEGKTVRFVKDAGLLAFLGALAKD